MRGIHARVACSTRFSTESLAPADLELDPPNLAAIDRIVSGAVPVGDPSPESV